MCNSVLGVFVVVVVFLSFSKADLGLNQSRHCYYISYELELKNKIKT